MKDLNAITLEEFQAMNELDQDELFNEELDEIDETYMDDIGGIHSPCDCYNPYGHFCGDCGKLSCKDCKYKDLQPDEE